MALLFSDGFDSYDVTTSQVALLITERWTLVTWSSSSSTLTTNKLGAMHFEDTERCLFVTTSGSPSPRMSKTLAPKDATCILGFALALNHNPPYAARSIAYIATGGSGTTAAPNNAGIQLSLVVNTDKTLSVYQGYFEGGGATLLGTSVAQLANFDASLHVFQYVEIKAVIGPAGSVEVRLSSAYNNFGAADPCPAYPSPSILTLTGVNTGPHGSAWDTISIVASVSSLDQFMSIDDLYVCDGSGANYDFIGPVVIASAGTEPYATINATYQSGLGSGFSNGGTLDTGDGGKNIGQGSFTAGRYADDGNNTFVVATVLGSLVSAHIDVPQAPPGSPTYYTPDRGVAGVIAFYDMKGIVHGTPLYMAQGLLRYPGGAAGTDYFGRQLDSNIVNTVTGGGSNVDYQQADPWDADPTGAQWTQAHLYSKLLGTNTAAAEFGIKCIGQTGSPDCQLGKVYVDVIYGHYLAVPPAVTQLPVELIYPFPYVAASEAPSDPWSPASADGTAGSATSGPAGPNANVGGCLPLQNFVDALSLRLNDPAFVHWTAVELQRYIIEALRTYQALTQSLRNRGTFLATTNEPFYDLPTVLPSLRGYNVTDLDLILDIEYALMEPPAIGTWTGTSQFTLAEIVSAIQRRRDLFLRETGAVLTREVRSVTPPTTGRIVFPDDVITIRRAAWISSANVVTPLQRDDEWGMNKYAPTWPIQSVNPSATWPTAFSIGVTPPLTLQVAPPITDAGSLDLLSVLLGSTLGSNVPGVLIGVPDDWTWVVKFGALSDLLSQQGVCFDPERAAYCEARWQQGITLAQAATVVLAAQVNGAVVPITSLSESDKYDPTWQTTDGAPVRLLTDAQNLVALSPPPDVGTRTNGYAVQLDLVVNFPIPINTTDCVDVDKSVMEIVIDYAQALSMFKEGPGLVQQSMALVNQFLRACGVTVELDVASVPNRGALFQQTVQDQRIVPRRSPPESQEPSA